MSSITSTTNALTSPQLPVAIGVLVLVTALAASPAAAQTSPPDYSGTWTFSATATLPDASVCTFRSLAEVDQDGTSLSGTAHLTLIEPAPDSCPAQVMGQVTAEVAGDGCLQSGMFEGGPVFGMASFDGCPQSGLPGAFSVETGPFAGTTGSWTIPRSQPGVPALSTTGLTTVFGLILLAGLWIIRRRVA